MYMHSFYYITLFAFRFRERFVERKLRKHLQFVVEKKGGQFP